MSLSPFVFFLCVCVQRFCVLCLFLCFFTLTNPPHAVGSVYTRVLVVIVLVVCSPVLFYLLRKITTDTLSPTGLDGTNFKIFVFKKKKKKRGKKKTLIIIILSFTLNCCPLSQLTSLL